MTLITSWVLFPEKVSSVGVFGVLAVTGGAYMLQADQIIHGPLGPFRAMFRHKGIRLILVTATLYSVTSVLSKRGVLLSSPETFPFLYYAADVLVLSALVFRSVDRKEIASVLRRQWRFYTLAGIFTAAGFVLHCIGIRMAPVPYFIAVKRISLLVTVLYGGLLYKEESFHRRVIATTVMVSGVAMIAFAT
jgi:uncharacterized membrane protein